LEKLLKHIDRIREWSTLTFELERDVCRTSSGISSHVLGNAGETFRVIERNVRPGRRQNRTPFVLHKVYVGAKRNSLVQVQPGVHVLLNHSRHLLAQVFCIAKYHVVEFPVTERPAIIGSARSDQPQPAFDKIYEEAGYTGDC
jgi:hypothetical protein